MIACAAGEFLRVVRKYFFTLTLCGTDCPKTIDADLPVTISYLCSSLLQLPGGYPTFGFTTAVQVGGEILKSMMADAKSTLRWYIIEAMGRKSGALALGLSSAAGCHLCLISEQWKEVLTSKSHS